MTKVYSNKEEAKKAIADYIDARERLAETMGVESYIDRDMGVIDYSAFYVDGNGRFSVLTV